MVNNPPASAGDIREVSSVPGSGRSPGGGHGNPLQYCLEIPWTEEPGGLQPMGVTESDVAEVIQHAHIHSLLN